MRGAVFYAVVFLVGISRGADPNEPPRYCKWDTFRAKCPSGSVIIMKEVLYGRMEYGKCIERDFGYVGCSNDVLPIADAKCSGRRDCQIPVPDIDMDAISECPNDLNRYLQATYDCLPVLSASRRQCQMEGVTKAGGVQGNIASVTTNETGCGGTDHPWLVKGEPGQKINFTLMDFAMFIKNLTKGSTTSIAHCHVYVIFKELGGKERNNGRSVTVCGGKQRIQQVYTSSTHEVEVRVLGRNRNFIVNFTVWGCPRIEKPAGGWVEQKGDHAEMGCNDIPGTWRITCNGTHWNGQKPNCSDPGSSTHLVIGKISLPYVASVIIIVIVAVVIGLSILLIGLICLRRQKLGAGQRRQTAAEDDMKNLPDEGHYKTTLKLSNPPPYYRSASAESPLENEYAYVEDFLPAPPLEGVPMNKMVVTSSQQHGGGALQYSGNSANHYGALGLSGKQGTPPLPAQVGPGQSMCSGGVTPRHYFELDMDMVGSSGGNNYSHSNVVVDPHTPRPSGTHASVQPLPLNQMLKYPNAQYP